MTTTESVGSANELRRGHLSLSDVIAQSVSVIAPAMSGGFLTYLAATKAGGATPLAYVLAAIGALFLGRVVSEFSKSMSSAGSLYTYVANGWNNTAGFVLGWVYTIALTILGAAVLAGFGFFMSSFIQAVTKSDTFIPWWIFFLLSLVFVAVMSLFNIRISTRAQLVLAGLSVAVMVVAAIIAIKDGGPNKKSLDLAAFWPSSAGVPWSGIGLGFAFGILSFTGFEAGAVLAEETSEPKRNIPKAIVGSVLVSAVFYVLVTYATSIGFGVKEAAAAWPTSASGLSFVMKPGSAIANLVLLAVAVSSLICGLGISTVTSRFLYAMGREKVLPAALGKTNAKWKTPWNAIFVYIILSVVLIFGLLAITSKETQIALGGGMMADGSAPNVPGSVRGGLFAFAEWATLAVPMVMFCYLLLGISAVMKGSREKLNSLRASGILAAVVGLIAVVGGLYYSFVGSFPDAVNPEKLVVPYAWKVIPWVFLLVVISGLAIAGFLKSKKPAAWADMGAVFDE
jgi:amino acid transporter